MLEKLTIENVALIERAEINFTNGLNVLSGETGAGKSVILESLNFVLGAKADKTLIKNGCDYCKVTAIFSSNNSNLVALFNEMDFECDEQIIISRKYTLDGKSSIKLNGNTITASMLKKITSSLVDLHGQSEHYELLSNANQLKLIDSLGEERINDIKTQIKSIYSNYKNLLQEIEDIGGDASHRAIRLDVLDFQINEIQKANLYEGEEQELLDIRQKINHQEKIISSLSTLKNGLSEENAVSDILNSAMRSLSNITNLSADYEDLSQRLSNVITEIDDISDSVDNKLEEAGEIDYNPQEIEDRLDVIKTLKRKYGVDYYAIIDFLEKAILEKEKIENYDNLYNKLADEKVALEQDIYNLFTKLSKQRKLVANEFIDKIVVELKELGMPNATFKIDFNEAPNIENYTFSSANGYDQVEFMFSANLGQPVKPLSAVISGGEISRFMLSIKAQSAKYNNLSTYVFDEIDAGISGIIALEVAKKFAKISKEVQIIAISHLPQISAMADNNLLIQKQETIDNTFTTVKQLNDQEKINEIVRLVGGIDSQSAKSLAIELIENAKRFKLNV